MPRRRWLTADTHFFHAAVARQRNLSVKRMNQILVSVWNDAVRPEDVVYHLGDLCWVRGGNWDKAEALVRTLHGRIHLVRGNHDPSIVQFKMHGWDRVLSMVEDQMTVGGVLLIHDPSEVAGWDRRVFCGHVHGRWLRQGDALNVGVDVWGYRPVLWEVARDLMRVIR